LQPGGILFLGSSETLGELGYAFETLDSKHRIFRKLPGVPLRVMDTVPALQESVAWTSALDERLTRGNRRGGGSATVEAIQRHLLERYAPATLVCTMQFELVYSLGPISQYLQVPTGPAKLDLLKMVPRDLSLAISTAASQAQREGRPVEYRAVQFRNNEGVVTSLCVQAELFDTRTDEGRLYLITIQPDSSTPSELVGSENFDYDRKLMERVAELERELQSTRENLQASIEQQETANEELQAANEELLAANEELQSTNEELESVNEELYTVNAEYQSKIQELMELNDDMENFTRSTDIGTVFLDEELRLRRFTPIFGKLTGLVPGDVGRMASAFSHPVLNAIMQCSQNVIQNLQVHEEVISLSGVGEFLLRVQPYRQTQSDMTGLVASLVDITRILDAEKELQAILQMVCVGIC
ncbi:MAG: PAS domain-containing protein, partial [Chthoniobacterales bacterium]|nr:PAS domain-containing protein [Chthoniobacterales bacterium]